MSRPVRFLVLVIAALLLPPVQGVRGEAARGGVEFLAPWPGALLEGERVILAGRLPDGAPRAYFLLNGSPLHGIQRDGRTFYGALRAARGFNEIEVRLGDDTALLTFVRGIGAASKLPYVYHKPVLDDDCDTCHDTLGKGGTTEAATCYRCHDAKAVLYPYVHGPVAAGACLVCHDPHGSSRPGLTKVPVKEMCTSCHDQPTTGEHTATSRSRVCTLCHNPHYGMKKGLLRATF